MKHSYYLFKASPDHMSFSFISLSADRVVQKKVEFVEISDQLYNLAFGDVDSFGDINDTVITNNKDTAKVLATVTQILLAFLDVYREAVVYFKGSTAARTRMYEIVLAKERLNWEDKLLIMALLRVNCNLLKQIVGMKRSY